MLLRTEQVAYQDESGTSQRLASQLCNVSGGYCDESGMEEKKIWRGTHQIYRSCLWPQHTLFLGKIT